MDRKKPRRPSAPQKNGQRLLKRKRDAESLEALTKKVDEFDTTSAEVKAFTDLPLTQATRSGLSASHFRNVTDIQGKAIPLALKGVDILGAAKTGSGKTLAFLVPVLENLTRKQWTEFDGLGALIVSPTRELAVQIFEVLRKIGHYHGFSAGLIIGGKSLEEERIRMGRMNILVCTPGRMLQHLDQTATFDVGNLQMLVLDEADRIMDMGFKETVDAIIEHLPRKRQTLLFSATQTKRVSDLARLSLKDPKYVSVHEQAESATPATLKQNYVVTPLPEKLDTLWSFLKANTKSKILVFLSSGKQVRFVYEAFRRMQPGIPLLHFHGRKKQGARFGDTERFTRMKHACLLSTDAMARGLDFPAVDWVIQHDCPEGADTYIHRVGRTARYEREGRAVLFLDPTEEQGMIRKLTAKKIPIEEIRIREKKQQSIKNQLQNMCFEDPDLKYLGQKAFISYTRSVYIQPDKEIFKIGEIPLEDFASSLGLPGAPRITFQKGDDAKRRKNMPRALIDNSDQDSDGHGGAKGDKRQQVRTRYDRMFERRNQDVLAEHRKNLLDESGDASKSVDGDADEDDDFLVAKQRATPEGDEESDDDTYLPNERQSRVLEGARVDGAEPFVIDSKRRERLLRSKKRVAELKEKGTKLVFDDFGNPRAVYELENEEDFKKRGTAAQQRADFLELEKERAKLNDIADKERAKQRKREAKEMKKEARKAARRLEAAQKEDDGGVQLTSYENENEQPGYNGPGEPEPKRQRKWFEHKSNVSESQANKDVPEDRVPQSLQELEALAAGYLA